MHSRKRRWLHIGMGIGLFLAGSVAGSTLTQKVSAVNRFGQPKTVIHVVAYKFRAATSQNDQDQAINGIRDMAGEKSRSQKKLVKNEGKQNHDLGGVLREGVNTPVGGAR